DRIVPADKRPAGQSPYRTSASPIRIGDDVWIGGGTLVLAGVTIGDNVSIGAGSIVTADIPSDSLALGQPCRVIRSLR
ncbi:MAG TPA: DapH/DapD/GlmU-related protein, partial [Gemmatimonadaceae bacterium]